MNIEKEKKCLECNGYGELATMEQVYPNEPHYAPIGTAKCDNCDGTGLELNEQLVLERCLDNLTSEQEEKLQKIFIKDNCEDLFETWLSKLSLSELENLLK